MAAEAPPRYQGDGYDLRRPVFSSNVIDLTDDDAGSSSAPSQAGRSSGRSARPPRFGREIIDVEEEVAPRLEEPSDSPEIQFVSSRPIDLTRSPNYTPFDQDGQDEDEVEFLSANPVSNPIPPERRIGHLLSILDDPEIRNRAPHLREQVERRERARLFSRNNNQVARMGITQMYTDADRGTNPRPFRFLAPTLNYGAIGFDMGYEEGADEPAPPPPTYNAPVAAPEGFTRSPQEEEFLVCPNCDDELCTGDSDQKRQVWLVKACGHVYCGECMANRHIKKSAKGKEKQAPARTKPFKECVVEGCKKKVSSKTAMIQVFL
ncbi:hypothetical protein N0V90_010535 [Kalmusia sp. IMI 367209]|nr:hypothetical protein N0V90_010535 [Kalmusia sp. IMI 367209]